jgi:hypothetical protein
LDAILILVAYLVYPIVIVVFGFFYIFYGSILYIFGPIVIALMPLGSANRLAKSYVENIFIWNAWPILYGGFGALLSAVQMGQIGQMLSQNDFLGGLGNLEGSILIGIVSIDGEGKPTRLPTLPNWALPRTNSGIGESNPACGPQPQGIQRGPIDQETTARIERFRRVLGDPIYGEILWRIARVRLANAIPNAQLQSAVADAMERASRGVRKAHTLAEQIGESSFIAILDRLRIESMTTIPSIERLKTLVADLEQEAARTAA